MLKVCVKAVTWNKPPYIPIPLSRLATNKLLNDNIAVKCNATITILENNMDLSFLKLRAFEINKRVNNEVKIFFVEN